MTGSETNFQTLSTPKQTWEELPLSMDFSRNMTDTETIDIAQSEVIILRELDNMDVTSSLLKAGTLSAVDNTKLQFVWVGGDEGASYCITFRAHISATKRLAETIIASVDNPCQGF